MFEKLKGWARNFKKQIYILYLSYKDERVPWYTKLFTACVVAYAFSPIDLIPDFIPILGYLDDVIIVPLGVMLALKMLPERVIIDCTEKAVEIMKIGKPKNWIIGSIIIVVWSIFGLGNDYDLPFIKRVILKKQITNSVPSKFTSLFYS